MKRKIVTISWILLLCAGLTGCGNPLEELPEVSEENLCNTEDETVKEVVEEIIETLTDYEEGGVAGEAVSLIVYDRDDDEEDRKKSELSVEVVIQTSEYEYTGYYLLEMEYTDKGWRVDELEEDMEEASVIKPLVGAEEQQIWDTIYYTLDEFTIGESYFYIAMENMGEVEVLSDEIYEENGVFYNKQTVSLEYLEPLCSYYMEYQLLYSYHGGLYEGENCGYWELTEYEYPQEYQQVYSDVISEQLSEERMLEDIAANPYYFNYYDEGAVFSAETCDYTFQGYELIGNYVYAYFTFTAKNTQHFTATTDITLEYYYDGMTCEYSSRDIEYFIENVNLSGNYFGVMYDSNGERKGDIYYSFLGLNEDGELYGAAKWTIDGVDNRNLESVYFVAGLNYTNYAEIDFEGPIYYGENNSVGYDYLYFNPATGDISSATYSYHYVLAAE